MSNKDSLATIEKSIRTAQKIAIGLIISVPTAYVFWFWGVNDSSLSVKSGDWGTFGDFVGGILNPVIAFFAFYWLTKSVHYQKKELSETRQALSEAKDAQKEQARYQFISTQIAALDTRLRAKQSDIENVRQTISYYVNQGRGAVFSASGEYTDCEEALSQLALELNTLLEERNNLQSDIAETISLLTNDSA
jgi:CHASE3 domain sensor protein